MTSPTKTKPVVTTSRAVWRGDRLFDAGPEGRTVVVDGGSRTGPGPVETFLASLASCSGVDILDILAKQRTPAERFEVRVAATRRPEAPRRVQRLELEYHIHGPGIEQEQAERAIQLSFEKYCSVGASLAPDIVVEATLVLRGQRFPSRQLTIWRAAI